MGPQEEEEGFVGNDDEVPIEPTQENDDDDDDAEEDEPLTRQHVWNLVFCLLAWGFTISNQTMGEYY